MNLLPYIISGQHVKQVSQALNEAKTVISPLVAIQGKGLPPSIVPDEFGSSVLSIFDKESAHGQLPFSLFCTEAGPPP